MKALPCLHFKLCCGRNPPPALTVLIAKQSFFETAI
ncbi:unnamed protein product [Musa acuminata subsp. malaccensis]|uniref:(wild Malaysian banana) hypothetical protein n=1 Tax=Musa acuminata subsp. malaccensis TaxID=214687 RepID=A0A804KJ03_MUSAM|nr:unnamed protein product [Musa acuminata subsp. malaccensis]